jgi:hypothetical protein
MCDETPAPRIACAYRVLNIAADLPLRNRDSVLVSGVDGHTARSAFYDGSFSHVDIESLGRFVCIVRSRVLLRFGLIGDEVVDVAQYWRYLSERMNALAVWRVDEVHVCHDARRILGLPDLS